MRRSTAHAQNKVKELIQFFRNETLLVGALAGVSYLLKRDAFALAHTQAIHTDT